MVGDGKEIVDGSVGWIVSRYDELRHVQTVLGKIDQRVLLGLVTAEAL